MVDTGDVVAVLTACNSTDEMDKLLQELLTESELSNIRLRWELMRRLQAGDSQRTIAADLGISLCKITRGSKLLKDKRSQVFKILVGE